MKPASHLPPTRRAALPSASVSPASPRPRPSASDAALPAAVGRPSQRERILDAAEAIVRDHGAAHLTLDAAAVRAGVSKGGLLYHFKTKELLLQAMIDRHMAGVTERHAAALSKLPPGAGRELKAWAQVAIDHEKCVEDKRVGCSLLAGAANDPKLLEPFHRFQQWRLQIVRDAAAAGLPFERTAVASLALDGLALLELLQLSPYDKLQRRAILEDILGLIDETVAAAAPPGSRSWPRQTPS